MTKALNCLHISRDFERERLAGGVRKYGLLVALLLLIPGCARFENLKADITDWNDSLRIMARLEGKPEEVEGAVIALWTKTEEGALEIQDLATCGPDGRIAFLLREREDYYLGAFKDTNENSSLDEKEPIWFYGKNEPQPVPKGSRKVTETKVVDVERKSSIHVPTLKALRDNRGNRALAELRTNQSVKIIAGEMADLDDPRFALEIGDQGLWEPTRFMRDHGVGVFFLQKYESGKLPLIFINGASGTPRNWTWIIGQLDRDKYQPWVYHYPSGLSLDESAQMLDRLISALETQYEFGEIGVIAHSMGGLLARRFVQIAAEREYKVAGLATLSTPWNGHLMAKYGVKYAPESVPSWNDIEPGSAFIERLFEERLSVESLLIYGDASKRSPFLPKENDGTVSVESMADERAIKDAKQVVKLPRNHIDILKSAKALKEIDSYFSR